MNLTHTNTDLYQFFQYAIRANPAHAAFLTELKTTTTTENSRAAVTRLRQAGLGAIADDLEAVIAREPGSEEAQAPVVSPLDFMKGLERDGLEFNVQPDESVGTPNNLGMSEVTNLGTSEGTNLGTSNVTNTDDDPITPTSSFENDTA